MDAIVDLCQYIRAYQAELVAMNLFKHFPCVILCFSCNVSAARRPSAAIRVSTVNPAAAVIIQAICAIQLCQSSCYIINACSAVTQRIAALQIPVVCVSVYSGILPLAA